MRKTIFLPLLLVCFLTNCNSQKNINKNAGTSISIMDKTWIAIEIANEKIEQLESDRFPNITLSERKISGYSSCNRMHGTYTLEKNKITFGPIVVTKMFCFDTSELEMKFLQALSEVKFWEYKQNKLYFLNEQKQVIIVFDEK